MCCTQLVCEHVIQVLISTVLSLLCLFCAIGQFSSSRLPCMSCNPYLPDATTEQVTDGETLQVFLEAHSKFDGQRQNVVPP